MRLVDCLLESRRPARVDIGLEFADIEDAVDKLHAEFPEDAVFLEESDIFVDVGIRRRHVIDIDLKKRLFRGVHDEGDVIVGAAEDCAAFAGFKREFYEAGAVVEVNRLFADRAVVGIGDERHCLLIVHDAVIVIEFHRVYLISFFGVPDKVACTEVDLFAVGHLIGNADLLGKFREYHGHGLLRSCAVADCATVSWIYLLFCLMI